MFVRTAKALGFLMVGVAVAALMSGCRYVQSRPAYENWTRAYDPERQGATEAEVLAGFNLHRGRWWNYYARGRWLVELDHCEAAVADFREAIRQREGDRHDARSYGMHFWEYCPHRELGIALLRLGRTDEAVEQLERAVADLARRGRDSARAHFYLNRARAEQLRRTGADKTAPIISFDAPEGGLFVRTRDVRLPLTVTDDHFVSSVTVNDRKLWVELASRTVYVPDYERTLRLKPGPNRLRVTATDLVGNNATAEVLVTVDLTPPLVCVRRVRPGGPGALVDLTAFDDTGLVELQVGKKRVDCGGAVETAVERVAAGRTVRVRAVDRAGNETVARIDLDRAAAGVRGAALPMRPVGALLALKSRDRNTADDAGSSPLLAALTEQPGTPIDEAEPLPVRVDLGAPKRSTVSDSRFFLDGTAYAAERDIASVFVTIVHASSGRSRTESVLGRRREGGYRSVAFSRWLPLELGENRIQVVATDEGANQARSRVITVVRVQDVAFLPAARYSLALTPLEDLGPRPARQSRAWRNITSELSVKPVRFTLKEKDQERLAELLVRAGVADRPSRRQARALGERLGASAMLYGGIAEGRCSVRLLIGFLDVESGEVLYETDVYTEDKRDEALREASRGVVSKLKRRFPLLEAQVRDVENKTLFLDLGGRDGLRPGMRMLLFRERRVGRNVLRRPVRVGRRQLEARVAETNGTLSTARVDDRRAASRVKVGYKVFTK